MRAERMIAPIAIAATLLVSLLQATSNAAESEEVEALIREGNQLRIEGKDAKALPLFEKAYELSRSPRAAAQLGLSNLALGYSLDAERYLAEALESPEQPWVRMNRNILGEALRRARAAIGEISVEGTPPDAEVWANGKPRGRLPLSVPLRLVSGHVEIQLRAPGYVTASKAVTVRGGQREEVAISLLPEPPVGSPLVRVDPPPGSSVHRPTRIDVGQPAITSAPDAEKAQPSSPVGPASNHTRVAAWTLGGGAAAGLTWGIAETVVFMHKEDEFNNHTAPDPAGSRAPIYDCTTSNVTPACEPLRAAHDRAVTAAVIGYSVGAALAVGSLVLFILSSEDREPSNAGLACAPSFEARGGACRFTF